MLLNIVSSFNLSFVYGFVFTCLLQNLVLAPVPSEYGLKPGRFAGAMSARAGERSVPLRYRLPLRHSKHDTGADPPPTQNSGDNQAARVTTGWGGGPAPPGVLGAGRGD